jgi:cytochrome c553
MEVIMKNRLSRQLLLLCIAGTSSGIGVWSGAAAAAGDPVAGAAKSVYCAYCHGPDGNPLDNKAPRLAGQDASVLVTKMKLETEAFGAHEFMVQAFMTGKFLNDEDMNDLAAYFSRQPVREIAQPAEKQGK